MDKLKNIGQTYTATRKIRIKRFHARWPSWVALVITAILYQALPPIFFWGPRGLMIGLVAVLSIPMVITFWHSKLDLSRYFGIGLISLITFYMIASVSRLVLAVLQGYIGPHHLLSSALALWTANVLVFALWYWSLDAGGPVKREAIGKSSITAFLFPQAQIALEADADLPVSIQNWEPHFIDYLFLAFNTSTAFSPTDTPVLSRWAKCMSMVQALISLTIIVMLAARGVGLLNPAGSYLVS
jgi:hypothetical protein